MFLLLFQDTTCVFFLLVSLLFLSKTFSLSGGIKNERKGQRQQHNKPSMPKKMWRKKYIYKRGKFNTQPGGSHGVSNCVIKYVTGSVDVSVEAWSLCHYCMKSMLLLCRRMWQHRHFCAKAQACIWLTVPAVKANFTNTFYLRTHSVKRELGLVKHATLTHAQPHIKPYTKLSSPSLCFVSIHVIRFDFLLVLLSTLMVQPALML